MDDLISRAAACECIGKMIHEYREKGEDDLADGMILARRYGIKCLPAVDAAPVVRCKDCKYWSHPRELYGMKSGYCNNTRGKIAAHHLPDENYFCADGERRESE